MPSTTDTTVMLRPSRLTLHSGDRRLPPVSTRIVSMADRGITGVWPLNSPSSPNCGMLSCKKISTILSRVEKITEISVLCLIPANIFRFSSRSTCLSSFIPIPELFSPSAGSSGSHQHLLPSWSSLRSLRPEAKDVVPSSTSDPSLMGEYAFTFSILSELFSSRMYLLKTALRRLRSVGEVAPSSSRCFDCYVW